MKVYIVRHGETLWNAQKKLQGWSDIELNEKGRELAGITAEALKEIPFDIAYTSPLIRAKETAQIIAGDRNIKIIEDERIKEIGIGEAEGRRFDEIITDKCENNFSKFFDKPEEYVPYKGGETFEMLCARAEDFIKNVIMKETHENILVTAHAAIIKAMLKCINNTQIKDLWGDKFHKNCAVTTVEKIGDKLNIIEEARIYY